MKKLVRKFFALLLCVMLCCGLMPVYASTGNAVWDASSSDKPSASAVPNAGNIAVTLGSGGTSGLTATVYKSTVCTRSYWIGWNRTANLRVKATVSSGSVKSYQWYAVPMSDFTYTDSNTVSFPEKYAVSGATKSSFTTPVRTDSNYWYFVCVVTDSKGGTAGVLFSSGAAISIGYPYVSSGPKGVEIEGICAFSILQGEEYNDDKDGHYMSDDYQLSSATKFQIYRREAGGDWESLKTIKGRGPEGPKADWSDRTKFIKSYTDTTAKMGVMYDYRYRAYLNDKWTAKTGYQSVTFNPFTDVSLDEDRAQYIAWAYNNSVVKGDGAGHFNPDDPCTRMNFVMILWKMHGKPTVKGSNPFTDVSGDTSVAAVKWAVKKKLVTGTSATTFSPDDNLSRINIIMILYKLAGSPKASDSSPYEDITGSKTTKAVNWAVSKGIISPVDTGHFDPDGNCSRALLVEILCKYNEIYKIL